MSTRVLHDKPRTANSDPADDGHRPGNAEPDEHEVPSQVGVGVEKSISYALRGGVIVSFVLVLTGLILGYVNGAYSGGSRGAARLLSSRSHVPHTLAAVADGVGHGSADGWIAVGLLVLVITPIVRVAASIGGFAYLHDHTYTVITAIVLALLAASFVIGGAS